VLSSYGRHGSDAYDLVDRLANGRARVAAWNAYVCQTYADKLAESCEESAPLARALYDLARTWLEHARTSDGDTRLELPAWGTLVRSQEQLVAMRETLDALRTYLAFEIGEDDPRLATVDAQLATVDELWIPRPTPELRAGIGSALTIGLKAAAALGAACLG